MKKKTFLTILISFLLLQLFKTQSYAAEYLPQIIRNLMGLSGDDGSGTNEFITARVRLLLLFLLGGLVLAAIVYAGLAGLKYIRSQGDPTQIEEAGKAIKAIFMGLGVLLVSIVGIVMIFIFFGAQFYGPTSFQTCLSAPGSEGCTYCQDPDGGVDPEWDTIKFDPRNPVGTVWDDDWSAQDKCTFCEYEYFRKSRSENYVIKYRQCRE